MNVNTNAGIKKNRPEGLFSFYGISL